MLVKPFRAYRPVDAKKTASYPYDIFSREVYRKLAECDESFIHVIRSDAGMPDTIGQHDDRVYEQAYENLMDMIQNGVLRQDGKENLYVYSETMDDRTQTGLVCAFPIEAYKTGFIKRHEKTLTAKVEDRKNHIKTTGAQTGSVFLGGRGCDGLERLLIDVCENLKPDVSFTFGNGTVHEVRVIESNEQIYDFIKAVSLIDSMCIIDGHHRMEAASQLCSADTEEAYQYMMGVIFPAGQLLNMSNNRVIMTKNSLSDDEILEMISEVCHMRNTDSPFKPLNRGEMGFYISGKWYALELKFKCSDVPDAKMLQDRILEPVFGITNPSLDERFLSVGGIEGTCPLVSIADNNDGVAFTLTAASIEEVFNIAEKGEVMPPKSTWFEPKILSGLFCRLIFPT